MTNRAATFQYSDGIPPSCIGIWLEFWPDGTFNCNCFVLLLRFVIFGVYAVLKWELHSHGSFISHEATWNSS